MHTCTTLYEDDSLRKMKSFSDECIELIMTSPPYADQRKKSYGGVHPDHYVKWFMPFADEMYRILNNDGSFVLNIKERVVDGERHTYVMELILEMKKRGWLYTEEYIWHKKNCAPGKWPNRFRDAWERCIHFTKQKKFRMYQDEVKVPVGDWADKRLSNLSETDKVRDESKSQSGFGKKIENWVGRDMVYPSNVLYLATECGNKNHSAAYPKALPEWFIKLLTKEGDVVLDPFAGSGTTLLAAHELGRNSFGIELNHEYCLVAAERLCLCPFTFEDRSNYYTNNKCLY